MLRLNLKNSLLPFLLNSLLPFKKYWILQNSLDSAIKIESNIFIAEEILSLETSLFWPQTQVSRSNHTKINQPFEIALLAPFRTLSPCLVKWRDMQEILLALNAQNCLQAEPDSLFTSDSMYILLDLQRLHPSLHQYCLNKMKENCVLEMWEEEIHRLISRLAHKWQD